MEIKKVNLKEQTYNLIKQRILEKQYSLGEQLVIAQISSELNVSNTPIREALSSLESEGLVKFEDGKYRVIELKGDDVHDLNKAILSQILAAFEIIINKNKISNLLKLEEKSLEEQKKLKLMNAKIDYEYVKTFVNFNRNFVIASENKYLLKVFDPLFSVLILTTSYNKRKYMDIHYNQHQEIYEALVEGKYEVVETILKELFNKDESYLDISEKLRV